MKVDHEAALATAINPFAGLKDFQNLKAAYLELHAKLETLRNDTLEEAAKVCDTWRHDEVMPTCCDSATHEALTDCAEQLRAMKRTSAQVPVRPVGRS